MAKTMTIEDVPLTCSTPNPQLVAMCQGSNPDPLLATTHGCCNVGDNRHFIYTTTPSKYGVLVTSCKLYCPRCCPACQSKKERESKDGNSESK
jgi:hypothetical protein